MYTPQGGLSDPTNKPLILVYYKVRGKLQPIRNMVCYLGLKFYEVYLEDNQEQKKKLPAEVINTLKGVRIDKSLLPLLVYEGLYIYDIYPIMAFLCRRFKHEELLGRNIRQKCKLQQILQIFLVKQPNSMLQMFKLSDFAAEKQQNEIKKEKKIYYQRYMNESNYLKELCEYLQAQKQQNSFVFGTITIIDFMFLQSCHYMLGLFNNLDQKCRCPITHQLIDIFDMEPHEEKESLRKHLQTMRNYLVFMYSQPFYVKNQNYLQSKTIICSNFKQERIRGLRNVWAFNPKLVE